MKKLFKAQLGMQKLICHILGPPLGWIWCQETKRRAELLSRVLETAAYTQAFQMLGLIAWKKMMIQFPFLLIWEVLEGVQEKSQYPGFKS